MTAPPREQTRSVGEAQCRVENPGGARRVVVTQDLPGRRWLEELAAADCRVEVCVEYRPLDAATIRELIGGRCDGVIGQLMPTNGGDCQQRLAQFAQAGIDVAALAARLQQDGAESFVKSWTDLLAVLEAKSQALARAASS